MRSFIVWIAGITERETACKAIRRWREPRATVISFLTVLGQLPSTHRVRRKRAEALKANNDINMARAYRYHRYDNAITAGRE
jgi:hypothetical protein